MLVGIRNHRETLQPKNFRATCGMKGAVPSASMRFSSHRPLKASRTAPRPSVLCGERHCRLFGDLFVAVCSRSFYSPAPPCVCLTLCVCAANQGPTLTIIETDDGSRFGGVTDASWSSNYLDVRSQGKPGYRPFLFCLNCSYTNTSTMLKISVSECHAYCPSKEKKMKKRKKDVAVHNQFALVQPSCQTPTRSPPSTHCWQGVPRAAQEDGQRPARPNPRTSCGIWAICAPAGCFLL